MKTGLTSFIFILLALSARSADRIRFAAKINGQQVKLAFDTGSEAFILFEPTVQALGLKWTNPPADLVVSPGKVSLGRTAMCDFEIGGCKTTGRFYVFRTPSYLPLDIDGVLPWKAFRNRLLYLNASERSLTMPDVFPDDLDRWQAWKLKADSETLFFEIRNTDGTTGSVAIDTGSPAGVELSESNWQAWRSSIRSRNTTLRAGVTPTRGLQIHEERWAEKLELGSFTIYDVPVSPAYHNTHLSHTDCEATLGLFALSRFEVILDYTNKTMYTKPVDDPPADYAHNRIAAVFAPADPSRDNDLIAHIIPQGPAYQAGIREGDLLLGINDLDVTAWRTTPGILPLSRFWSQPPGTKITLRLMRNGKSFDTAVILRDILYPRPAAPEGDTASGQEVHHD